MARSTLLILNRKSAARPDVRAAVRALPQKIDVIIPWDGKALRKAVRKAAHKGTTRIIAGGGDGTVNAVANAILKTDATDLEMALIPLGTANDFARSWGDDGSDIAASLKAATSGAARPIDAGRINGRAFVNVASGGFGAMITATTDKDLKRQLGGLAYSLTGLARISELKATPARFSLNRGPVRKTELLALIIANNRFAGGGYDVAPDADISDGQLDLGALTLDGLRPDADKMARLLDPADPTGGFVERLRLRHARIETETPFHINLDGEPMVDTTFEITVEPGALNFVIP